MVVIQGSFDGIQGSFDGYRSLLTLGSFIHRGAFIHRMNESPVVNQTSPGKRIYIPSKKRAL